MARMTSSRRRQQKSRKAFLGQFFRWWHRELAALVPPGLRPKNRPSPRMLWVGKEAGALVLWRLTGQKRYELGRVNLVAGEAASAKIAFDALRVKAGAGPVGICLASSQVLRKEVVLPLATAESLNQVLGFELGRQTPYTVDQAYYDQRVLREDLGENRLHVLLGVTPRTVVDEILSHFSNWGVTPHAVVACDELESAGDCLNLLPPGLRPKPSRAGYWIYAAMAGVTLLLFAVLLAIPIWKKREVAIALQPKLAQAQEQADAVDALKREQERLLADYTFPIEHKLATPARVALLDEVTRILPDNTWLQQLEIHDMEISMQGTTSSSAKLIGLFEQSALLENASFKSPLVKGPNNEERFQLAAELKVIDLARALAAQRELNEIKKPAKAAGKSGKQSGKKP
jgi:general secretion pathway protein L